MATPNLAAAAIRYEAAFRPLVAARPAARRRMAGRFVPRDRVRLVLRDWLTRLATPPAAAPFLRREFGLT